MGEKWFNDKILNYELNDDPTVSVGGFDLERREWSLLNKLRTGFGCCNELYINGTLQPLLYVIVVMWFKVCII